MNSEDLKDRTKSFAHRCVRLAAALPSDELGRVIRGQLMRSATSVAANYRAACIAQTKAIFTSKISHVFEECDESAFWLEFVIDEGMLGRDLVSALLDEAVELTRIFGASRRTAQARSQRKVRA